jgi:hypothetical protein
MHFLLMPVVRWLKRRRRAGGGCDHPPGHHGTGDHDDV